MSVATESGFDAGVLEELLQALGLPGPFPHDGRAVAGQITQSGDLSGRHEASPQQTALEQLGQPGGVGCVGLASRQVLHVAGVGKEQFEARSLEHVPDRLPEHPGRLHGHLRHALGHQPLPQLLEVPGEGPELHQHLAPPTGTIGGPDARHHRLLVHIEGCAALHDHVHNDNLPFAFQGVPSGGPLVSRI